MTANDAVERQIVSIMREYSRRLEPLPVTDPLPSSFPGPGGKPQWTGSIKAILFDIYGTLLISAAGDISDPDSAHSPDNRSGEARTQQLLREYGIQMTPDQAREQFAAEVLKKHRQLNAQGVRHPEIRYPEIWSAILDITDGDALKIFAARYETSVNPVWPMPHLEETLTVLKEKGVLMGIISNAQFFTPLLFPALLGKDLLQMGFSPNLLFYSYRYGCAKPADFLYKKAAAALAQRGIQPGETAYIGNDMLNDILPAQRAGFKGILFAGDRRSLRMRRDHPDCRLTIPDAVVTGIGQITEYFRQ